MDIAVIGGGPAGLFAAIHASQSGKVTVLERGDTPGRKLLITASGQCNLTHEGTPEEFLHRYQGKGEFLKSALESFTPGETISWFTRLGLKCTSDEDGKVFPASRRAADVLRVLTDQCAKFNVRIISDFRVNSASKTAGGFSLCCADGKTVRASRIIIATGGITCPATGSSGDGFKLAQSLGHRIVTPRLGLCGITAADHFLRPLSGVAFSSAVIRVSRNGRDICTHEGPLVITSKGFSGPAIVDRSSRMDAGDTITIDFTGSRQAFIKRVIELASLRGSRQLATVIHEAGIPRSLVSCMLQHAGIDGARKSAEVSKKQLLGTANLFTSSSFTIAQVGDLFTAMVTAGGVDTSEVNHRTMESLLTPGLFFAGEVLDIDGESGGYNLQAAWSTGALAGRSCLA